MSEALRLNSVALARSGKALDFGVQAGESVAILGPAGSGKTKLLRIMAGLDAPAHGFAEQHARVAFAGAAMPRRGRVQTLARLGGPGQAARATDALTAVGLWEARQHSLSELSPGQLIACELLGPLASDAGLLAFDGQLDDLDPWALHSALALLWRRLREGAAAAIVTNRPDIAARCDFVIALKSKQPVFADSLGKLLDGRTRTMEIVSENPRSAAALVKPFTVDAVQKGGELELKSVEGQALAAKLLTQGYGDVRLVVTRDQSLEEALRDLM